MLHFPRPPAPALVLVALLPAGGCCTIAGLLCGPDRSRWVSVDYREPDQALATLLEAIRRDNPRVVYESLSEAAKERYGVLGVMESTIAWQELKRRITGLHLAGSAAVVAAEREADGRFRYDLALAGRSFTVRVVAQPFWEVSYVTDDSAELERAGRFVDARAFHRMLVIQTEEEPAISVTVRDPLLPDIPAQQVREVRVSHAWKVDEISGIALDP